MKFVNTQFYFLLILPVLLALVYIFAVKQQRKQMERFASGRLLPGLILSYSSRRQRLKMTLMLAAVLLSIVAVLRPQWGFVWEKVEHRGIDCFVAVDVSKSMLTKDVLPSRLERAKLALEDLVQELQGDRVGLIAFAGSAFVQCPLTIDYDGFLLAVEDLNVYSIPQAGTNIENAIEEARRSFTAGSQGVNRALIIISDGESHEGNPAAAAEKAAKENIKIYTIGVGTTEGELISVSDENGNSSFLKDSEGHVVKSRLNEALLRDLALKSAGMYVKATPTQFGLDMVYNNKIAPMEKKELKSSMEKRFLERFQIPLVLALMCLFIEPFISNRKRQ